MQRPSLASPRAGADSNLGHQWLLKDGFALELRLPDRARATKDVDLDWRLTEDAATSALIDGARLDLGGLHNEAHEPTISQDLAWIHA